MNSVPNTISAIRYPNVWGEKWNLQRYHLIGRLTAKDEQEHLVDAVCLNMGFTEEQSKEKLPCIHHKVQSSMLTNDHLNKLNSNLKGSLDFRGHVKGPFLAS